MSATATSEQERASFRIKEFCARHGISLSGYHKMKREGRGPVESRVGDVVRISIEEELAWLRAAAHPKGKALEERRLAEAKSVARGKNAGRLAMQSSRHIANERRAKKSKAASA